MRRRLSRAATPARRRPRRRALQLVAAISIAVGAALVAVSSLATGLDDPPAPGGTGQLGPARPDPTSPDRPRPGADQPGRSPHAPSPVLPGGEQRVPVTDAVTVYATATEAGGVEADAGGAGGEAGGAGGEAGGAGGGARSAQAVLAAGDAGGGAVTYLRFQMPETGRQLRQGVLQLTAVDRPLPELVELVSVPDTSWRADRLTWQAAPAFGPAVWTARPHPEARQVVFELTSQLARPGWHAFALTVPPDRGRASFVGTGEDRPVLRLTWGSAPAPGQAGSEAGDAAPDQAAPARSRPTAPDRSGDRAAGQRCQLRELLVPSCGVLWGVAPDGLTGSSRSEALTDFEEATGRRQDIYHAYHRADALFPTAEEVAIAEQGRLLFLNWKPRDWTWAQIAAGDAEVDSYLDRLAGHIRSTFTEPFFFTIHHEPENDVKPRPGSGMEATDYAAMYRHVVERLRGAGVTNLVTVINYLAYVPWSAQPWFPELYPGDDVVDWIAWNSYAYSEPGYGHGDFAELMNRRSSLHPQWPGFYNWATEQFPDKPFMLGEWGVWHSDGNPGHMAEFYGSVGRQAPLFPRVKAMVYFDTPSDQRKRDSRPTLTDQGLDAFRRLGAQPYFQVQVPSPAN